MFQWQNVDANDEDIPDCATLGDSLRSFHNIIFDATFVETNFKMFSLALLAYLLHLGV